MTQSLQKQHCLQNREPAHWIKQLKALLQFSRTDSGLDHDCSTFAFSVNLSSYDGYAQCQIIQISSSFKRLALREWKLDYLYPALQINRFRLLDENKFPLKQSLNEENLCSPVSTTICLLNFTMRYLSKRASDVVAYYLLEPDSFHKIFDSSLADLLLCF